MISYYHEVVPNFNYWYIILPVMTIIMVIIGIKSIYKKGGKVYAKHFRDRLASRVAFLATIIITLMMLLESHSGVLQILDNQLSSSDSPLWSLIFFGPTFFFIGVTVYAFLYLVYSVTGWLKLGFLVETILDQKHEASI